MSMRLSNETKHDILIVDDDRASLRTLSTMLEKQGYEVRRTIDGPTALMIASEDPPDLVLLDVLMPGMDGFEVCRELKSNAATAEIPVIFCSALGDAVDIVHGFQAGGVDYITKPYNAPEVEVRVKTHLDLYRLRRELSQRNAELQREIREHQQVRDALQQRTRELGERVKELNCVYSISALIERPSISLEEILQGTAELIPPAWQYPEIACARIVMNDQEFRSERFRETAWKQESHLSKYGERIGSVQVYYLEEKPHGDRGPFLREERDLLDAITERLSRVIERFSAERARQRRVKEMSTLHHIAQMVVTVGDLTEALESVAEVTAEMFDARSTLFLVPDDKDAKLHVLAGFGRESGPYHKPTVAFSLHEAPLTHKVLDRGQPIVLPDLRDVSLAPSFRALVRERDLQAMLFVPLSAHDTVVGVLAVGLDQSGRTFTPGEISLAEMIAADVAVALENARLAEQAQAAAIDAERQRLARELHDSVTQSLYSLTLLSKGWGTMAEQGRLKNPAAAFQRLNQVGQQALKEMRLMIHQLRPPILEELGLVGALRQRLDAVEQRANVEARLLTSNEVIQLPQPMEDQLFYIAQEALNNSLRHAAATEIIVRIEVEEGGILLSVKDDGIGFDPSVDSAGIGLTTMQARAEDIGGRLTITSEREQGTTVKVIVDMERDEGV
jgi:signal transduction histidine kinase/DNA-binding response OmpR family regulator